MMQMNGFAQYQGHFFTSQFISGDAGQPGIFFDVVMGFLQGVVIFSGFAILQALLLRAYYFWV